ncbi:hypothetical protein Jab_2c07650 [Janthinobacterium sp. HH01]|uniref:hypothetical protein n=1 Tax=Janthinobacterium sp. HH01 TaxID=1198452 RepID=UPI0002AE7F67|nr:hypothetical protein [Janthinobacterium sp. HH01]ELX08710.1 hypothetical protein Jab_2c07650 [Janthinobacterium sp. HH01]
MNSQPAVAVAQPLVPPPPHPLSVLIGPAAYNTVLLNMHGKTYAVNDVLQQANRLPNPLVTQLKIRTLVPAFVQSSQNLAALTAAFDLAVPILGTWTTGSIQQLLVAARTGNGANRQPGEWGLIAAELTAPLLATHHIAAQFIGCVQWATAELVLLAQSFNANQRTMNATQWAAIAGNLQGGNCTAATALEFVSLPPAPWTPGLRALVALAFQTAAQGLTAAEYAAIAAALTGGRGSDTNVRRFAAMPNYPAAQRAAMAASFEANQAGLSSEHWLLVAEPLTGGNATAASAEAFARLPLPWTRQERRALAVAFEANAYGMSAAEWAAVATALAPAHVDSLKCTTFLAIPVWAAAEKALLAAAFHANARGMTAVQWAAIAASLTGVRAISATAAIFASLAGWPAAERALLSAAYEANQQGMNVAEWATLAGALTDGRATRDNAVAFAGLAAWPNAEKIALAQAFNAHQYGMTALQWAAIAAALNGVHRTSAIALNFMNLPQWTAAERALLAASFIVNQRHRTAIQWAALAVNLTAGRATTATATAMLDIAGWNAVDEAALAQAYNANQHGDTAAAWVNVAATYAAVGHARVLRTARHMAYLGRGWPTSITLNTVNFDLRALGGLGPGLVYEAGHFPHITIHDMALDMSPDQWRWGPRDYQVVRGAGAVQTYPYVGTLYKPFVGSNPANDAPAQPLAQAFWQHFL